MDRLFRMRVEHGVVRLSSHVFVVVDPRIKPAKLRKPQPAFGTIPEPPILAMTWNKENKPNRMSSQRSVKRT
jgi:hypothetical protein